MVWSYGVKSVIIIQRGDSWGDGVVNLFKPAWLAKGGVIAGEVVRYAAEATDFSNYLQTANGFAAAAIAANGGNKEKVGVLVLSFEEFPVIASQAKDYAAIYDVPYFGGDGTALSQRAMDDAPTQVNHMRVFSLQAKDPGSSLFYALRDRYQALTKQQYSAYTAYAYDIEFMIAESIIAAQSSSGKDVIPLQMGIALQTWGAGGWCQLNLYGDRAPPLFNVWFYAPGKEPGTGLDKPCISHVGGVYNPDTKVMTWDTGALQAALGYVPKGP
jgi:ABC-type branched-subunit amino acid transport system substrate-binding protein